MSDWATNDPNALWNQFKNAFKYVADVHAPIKTRRVRSTEMNYRDYLKKRAVKTSHQRDYEAYKKQRNRVNKLVKIGKVKYYHEVINKDQSNPKAMWKHMNQLVGKGSKTTQIQRIKVNDSVFTKNDDIANVFNAYFAEIGENLSSQIPQTNFCIDEFIEPVSAQFELNHLVIDDVKKVIRKLDGSMSCGLDKIPANILKDCNEIIAPYLTYIYNCSISTAIFPDDWKMARVSPIFKAGTKEDSGNYRPISILSTVAKIFEKLICDQISIWLIKMY